MKTTKVIVVNPKDKTVEQKDWDGEMKSVYDWVGTDMLDHVTFPIGPDHSCILWVDDIGLMKPNPDLWLWPSKSRSPLAGNGVLICVNHEVYDDEGEVKVPKEHQDVPYTVEQIKNQIYWPVESNHLASIPKEDMPRA